MEQFDDMLRNSLASDYPENRFEFKEEYWLQAQTLIESYERKRKRRFIFWVFGGLMLGGLATAYFYHFGEPQPQAPAGTRPPASELPMAQRSTLPASTNLVPAHTNSVAFHSNSKDNSIEYHQENNLQNNLPALVFSEGSFQKTALQDLPPAKQTLKTTPETAEMSAPLTERQMITNITQAPGLTFGYLTSERLPMAPIVMAQYKDLATEAATANVYKPKKWYAGIVTAAGTPSGLFDKEAITLAGGAIVQYEINEHWSLNASINWRRWKGRGMPDSNALSSSSDAINQQYFSSNSTKSYSFGYHQITTNSYIKSFHSIEIPISAAYRIKDIVAEAGLLLSWVAFTQNQLDRFEESSLAPQKQRTNSTSFLSANDETYLQKFIPGATAGIFYSPEKHWSVGLRSTFRTKENSYSAEYLNSTLKEQTELTFNSFTTDLQFRWFF